MPIDHENSFVMALASISTTLAEVTPYWEPALWVLIVVVTAGIVGSALWAPSRSGRRRSRRKLFRRSDARVSREERATVAASAVPASGTGVGAAAVSDLSPEPDVDEIEDQANDVAEPVADAPPQPLPGPVVAVANGASTPEHRVEPSADPAEATRAVAFADVEAGFARLAFDVAVLGDRIEFFDERSNVPPEMPTWPIEHQQALAERAAEALAGPLDELLEHSLAVASDVRALDRLLGGRCHDDESAQAIVATRVDLDALRCRHGGIHRRFTSLAGDFAVLSGTAEQLARVGSIIDATDAVMGSWQPTMVEAARTVSARR